MKILKNGVLYEISYDTVGAAHHQVTVDRWTFVTEATHTSHTNKWKVPQCHAGTSLEVGMSRKSRQYSKLDSAYAAYHKVCEMIARLDDAAAAEYFNTLETHRQLVA